MKIKLVLIILCSFIGGILITLFTGFFTYPTGGLIGAKKWGFPFYWLSQPVYPGAEKTINWSSLIIDLLIWSSLLFMIIIIVDFLLSGLKSKKNV